MRRPSEASRPTSPVAQWVWMPPGGSHPDPIPTIVYVISSRSIALQTSGYLTSSPNVLHRRGLYCSGSRDGILRFCADAVAGFALLKLNDRNGKSKIMIQVSLKLQTKYDKAGLQIANRFESCVSFCIT